MKKIFKFLSIVVVFASCQNFEGAEKNNQKNETKQAERKSTTASLAPVARDISINTENAYNDLFFR